MEPGARPLGHLGARRRVSVSPGAHLGDWSGVDVLVTGSTGFKGAWLSAWLARKGARVTGAALPPPSGPSLFGQLDLARVIDQRLGDIRDPAFLEGVVASCRPRVVLHLAAQAIVRASYADPVATFATNVLGTAHLLEALRRAKQACAVVVVTSDKCYENVGWERGYRESDPMGGHDPYSASKGCAELLTSSWRRSFWPPARLAEHGVALASARAGNVVGPGDWARDRILPDAVRALAQGEPVPVRNPGATRPWQHVLEALGGYLALATRLRGPDPAPWCEGWNFGPRLEDARPVRDLVDGFCAAWGGGAGWKDHSSPGAPHEAPFLRLSIEKAADRLGWHPAWHFEQTVQRTAVGYKALLAAGTNVDLARAVVHGALEDYEVQAAKVGDTRAAR